jgi:hypothetical protein
MILPDATINVYFLLLALSSCGPFGLRRQSLFSAPKHPDPMNSAGVTVNTLI